MPVIRIELYSGRTKEQKSACASDVIVAVAKHRAPAQATQVIFVDVDKADWITGAGGTSPPDAKG
jgi:phenylpyruvate tautomerase PptA (4-oxalocrotonate tautomerase family)